ncbi:MAG: hypothetical protein AAFX02_05410 [Pseudomonadota bacterium]
MRAYKAHKSQTWCSTHLISIKVAGGVFGALLAPIMGALSGGTFTLAGFIQLAIIGGLLGMLTALIGITAVYLHNRKHDMLRSLWSAVSSLFGRYSV